MNSVLYLLCCRATRWSTATRCPHQTSLKVQLWSHFVLDFIFMTLPPCLQSHCDSSLSSPASSVSHCLTDASTRGAAVVPKVALDVMSCEVVRLLQLTDSNIVPISYRVPRKVRENDLVPNVPIKWRLPVCMSELTLLLQQSGQEFHEDLFPDTAGSTAAMSAEEWWQGGNKQVSYK